jgi:PAS domain S-box-containing protein
LRNSFDGRFDVLGSSNTDDLELFRLAIEQGPDAVIVADMQGLIRIWNNAAADLFGYDRDEAIAQSLDIIIPEKLRHAHWEGFHAALTSGHTKHARQALRTRAVHRTGKKMYVSIAFSVLRDRKGMVIGAMATARELPDEPKRP